MLFPGVFVVSLTLAYISTKFFDYELLGIVFSSIMWGSLVGILLILTGIRKSRKALRDKDEYYAAKREKNAREDDTEETMEADETNSLKNYYTILDLNENATSTEIKDAYRILAKQWHPDKHTSLEGKQFAEVRMKEINQAYEKLRKFGMLD